MRDRQECLPHPGEECLPHRGRNVCPTGELRTCEWRFHAGEEIAPFGVAGGFNLEEQTGGGKAVGEFEVGNATDDRGGGEIAELSQANLPTIQSAAGIG